MTADEISQADLDRTADPGDESTWSKPCIFCGHTPGCEWNDMGYAWCAECFAD